MNLLEHCLVPDWPAPSQVKALQTTRHGGVSTAPYDTLNLGLHVGDDPVRVNQNRMRLAPLMPSEPVWLEQVHGTVVANADAAACRVVADACIARRRGSVCVVMTADCLPVLLCAADGSVVGAAHAGWRGLCDGVIEATVTAMGIAPHNLIAWLGPAISQAHFEVGEDVRAAFVAHRAQAAEAFIAQAEPGKYRADLYLLARQRLHALGVNRIFGGGQCTFGDRDRFFSYRRDGVTGRMGTFIWLT
ncbi:peptidoglycan editing factor PgeF [Ferrigenium sp. UT5]|uniref:peptidoglycan editing factor PgeF n=1 Tax=Ferrigenium sp. UT5 TaxID=3242105 RepID=UPI00354F61A8